MKRFAWIMILLGPALAHAQSGLGGSGVPGPGMGADPRHTSIALFGQLFGTYTNGLTPTTLDDGRRLSNYGSSGVTVGAGITGSKVWKRSVLNINYFSRYRYRTNFRTAQGMDHFLSSSYSRLISPRTSAYSSVTFGSTVRSSGSIFTGGLLNTPGLSGINNSLGGAITPGVGSGVGDTDSIVDPTEELIDSRIKFLGVSTGVTQTFSSRLSGSVGAASGFVLRRGPFASVRPYLLGGNLGYVLGPRQTVGINYNYTLLDFNGSFGKANFHRVGVYYQARLSEYWTFRGLFGIYRANILRSEQVQLDPLVAELLGRPYGIEPVDRTFSRSNYSLFANRTFRNAGLSFGYAKRPSGGNGLILAGETQAFTAGYSYRSTERLSLFASATYSRLSALAQDLSPTISRRVGTGANYRLTDFLQFSSTIGYARTELRDANYSRNYYFINAGISFSSSPYPLPVF